MTWARELNIGATPVGPGHPCYIIAEIASNHGGNLEQALQLIQAAHDSGANAVNFHLFAAYGLVARRVRNKNGKMVPNPHYPLVEQIELPLDYLPRLWTEAANLGIELIMTPFGIERLVAWVEMGARAIKIAAGDLNHIPLLRAAGASGLPILLACGMSDLPEITDALRVLHQAGAVQIALMHSIARYPAAESEVNLKVIPALEEKYELSVGFSDHAQGNAGALGAVSLGAQIIEKRLTLDRALPGPDHAFAVEPDEFATMVSEIRRLERMLGEGNKERIDPAHPDQIAGRRSIVGTTRLQAGKILMREDLKCVRPGGGLAPAQLTHLIGKKLKRDIQEDEMILADDVV